MSFSPTWRAKTLGDGRSKGGGEEGGGVGVFFAVNGVKEGKRDQEGLREEEKETQHTGWKKGER